MKRCNNSSCQHVGDFSVVKLLACARCRTVNYCSSKCQREDWEYHKKACATNKSTLVISSSSVDLGLGESRPMPQKLSDEEYQEAVKLFDGYVEQVNKFSSDLDFENATKVALIAVNLERGSLKRVTTDESVRVTMIKLLQVLGSTSETSDPSCTLITTNNTNSSPASVLRKSDLESAKYIKDALDLLSLRPPPSSFKSFFELKFYECHHRLATLYINSDKLELAEIPCRKAHNLGEKLYGGGKLSTAIKFAYALEPIASLRGKQRNDVEWVRLREKIFSVLQKLAEQGCAEHQGDLGALRKRIHTAEQYLIDAYIKTKAFGKAENHAMMALNRLANLGLSETVCGARFQHLLAVTFMKTDRRTEAEAECKAAVAICDRLGPPFPSWFGWCLHTYSQARAMQSKSDEITETLFIRALECLRDGIEDTSAIHFEFAVYMRGKGDSDSSLQHFVVAERVAGIFSHIPVNKSIRETSQAMIKLIESGGQMPMGLNCDRERFREGKKNERSQMKLKAAEEVPDAPLPTTDSLDLANETNLGVVSNIGNSKGNRRGRDRGSDRPPSPPSAPRHNP